MSEKATKDLSNAYYMGVGYGLGTNSILGGLVMFGGFFTLSRAWDYIAAKFT